MDAREEIKRWLLTLTQLAADSESEQINADIELLMGVTLQYVFMIAFFSKV